MKWNELYNTEQELIDDMMKCKTHEVNPYHNVKGYVYIDGFKKYYINHGELTPKQMTQLKRLASAIHEHITINNLNNESDEEVIFENGYKYTYINAKLVSVYDCVTNKTIK